MKAIPNLLTLFRIFSGPVCLILLFMGYTKSTILLVVVSSATDFLDGYLARKYNSESKIGRVLDPIADKIFMACLVIGLAYLEWAPKWLVGMIILRDACICLGALHLYTINMLHDKLKPSLNSKVNTAIQLTFIFLSVLTQGHVPSYVFWIVSLSTLFSGIEYANLYLNTLRQSIK